MRRGLVGFFGDEGLDKEEQGSGNREGQATEDTEILAAPE